MGSGGKSMGQKFSRCESQPQLSEMAQVLDRAAGLESGNLGMEVIYKYFLLYNTSFNSSCLQFIRVGTSSIYHYMVLFLASLGFSVPLCKVGLMVLTLPISPDGKNQRKKSEVRLPSSS